jgi:two-component system LytT family response regulator
MIATPILVKRLQTARRIPLWSGQTGRPAIHIASPGITRIPFHVQSGVVFINPDEVTHLEADSNYTTIHLRSGKSAIISKTLKYCTDCFPRHFLRIHQSFLVNPAFLCEYNSHNSCIEIETGQILPVSRARKAAIKAYVADLTNS